MDNPSQKIFVCYNPKAGDQIKAAELLSALQAHFPSPQWSVEIYEINGEDDVTAVCRSACEQGLSLLIAAGGDGTLVSAANALVHRQIPLGILPLGTGNLLAKVLRIPIKLDDAIQLLAGENETFEIDVLKAGDSYFLSNVSVGISPIIMGETSTVQKKRFGMLAYIMTTIKHSSLFNLRSYILTIDGQPSRVRASEVLISNMKFLEKATSLYGPPETLSDGQFEVYLVTAHGLSDYLRLLWEAFRHPGRSGSKFFHWQSHHSIRIDSYHAPQLVQGDGEVIGHTPVEVQMVPRAIRIIMPKNSEA